MRQITRNDGTGYEWLIDICNYIDNQDTLEMCLKQSGFPYKVTQRGLYANPEDVRKVDHAAQIEAYHGTIERTNNGFKFITTADYAGECKEAYITDRQIQMCIDKYGKVYDEGTQVEAGEWVTENLYLMRHRKI